MKKTFSFVLLLFLLSGCASVMPVEPVPENFTLTEAEKVIEKVITRSPLIERYNLTDQTLSFVNTSVSGKTIQIPLKEVLNIVTKRGFSGGEYHPAMVTVYFKDSNLSIKKIIVDCVSLREAENFTSSMTKLSKYSKNNQNAHLAELERAYNKGILSREEYLNKKEKMAKKL